MVGGRRTRRKREGLQHEIKGSLQAAFQASGLTKREWAHRLGKHEREAQRWLDLDHRTSLDVLGDAFKALGKRVRIVVEDDKKGTE